MTKLILLRHGESIANSEGIYQGQSYDTDLTDRGRKEAELVAAELSKIYSIDRLITSPLKRTKQTALIINDKLKLKIEEDKRIIEYCHGVWEGKKKENVAKEFGQDYLNWKRNPRSFIAPGSETIEQMQKRAAKFSLELSKKEGTVLVVTHDFVIRSMLCDFLGMPLDNMWRIYLDNCSISVVDLKEWPVVEKMNFLLFSDEFRADISQQGI